MSSRIVRTVLPILGVAALAACSQTKTQPKTAAGPQVTGETTTTSVTTTVTTPPPAPRQPQGPMRYSPPMRMSSNLPDRASEAPKFSYKGSELSADDQDILHRVGDCLTSGPMQGKRICIAGYTDPRGSAKSNMELGKARAYSVEHFLAKEGVKEDQMAVTSLGKTDAKGKNEHGWAEDRRVEISLADAPDSPCRGNPTE